MTSRQPIAQTSETPKRLEARAGIAQPDAERRIDETFARLNQAKETAKQAAERARKIAALTAVLTAAAPLVSGASAWWAAKLGGEYRDEDRAGSPAAPSVARAIVQRAATACRSLLTPSADPSRSSSATSGR